MALSVSPSRDFETQLQYHKPSGPQMHLLPTWVGETPAALISERENQALPCCSRYRPGPGYTGMPCDGSSETDAQRSCSACDGSPALREAAA